MTLKRVALLGSLLAGLCLLIGSALAQSNEIILTVAIEEVRADMLSERVLQGFYETHPGVKVVPVMLTGSDMYYGLDTINIENVLDKAKSSFSKGDVVMIREDYNFLPLITRAGYALDLTPYLRSDSSGAVDDFYPVASKMFVWDNGVWGLPAALYTKLMVYNVAAFEAAGYPVPDASWTMDQYLDAAEALTTRDANGRMTQPGFMNFDERMVLRLMSGHGFYDASAALETPSFSDPALEPAFVRLGSYLDDLAVSNPDGTAPWNRDTVPLQMADSWMIGIETAPAFYMPVLLPDAPGLVSGQGFAVSSGTQYPDLAYELAMYLTGEPEVVAGFYSDSPARRSLTAEDRDELLAPTSEIFADALPEILENGMAWSELRYGEYLWGIRFKRQQNTSLTLRDALQLAEEEAVVNLEAAAARLEEPVVVSTPVPTPQIAAGEIAIKFLVQTNYATLTNPDQWQRVQEEFISADPQVGSVEVVVGQHDPMSDIQEVDCAYLSRNYVSLMDSSLLQPLDPFLATDSTFDRSDIPALVWPQVARDGQIYALPMTMTPLMMWYNPKDFEAVGLAMPENSWTISDFIDAVTELKAISPEHKVYRSQNYGSMGYVMLASALGGLAIDYSTPTPTYHLTDPAVVEALRQTLDLAKQGYIEYVPLKDLMNGQILVDDRGVPPTLYEAVGYVYDWNDIGTEEHPHLPVTFPQGTEMTPLSYSLGTGYITASTPYTDACYRWLSTLAQHPELFNEMPAKRSQANSDVVIAAHGQQASDFYVRQFALLDSANAVVFPEGNMMDTSSSIMQVWFDRALDAYVLDNADLIEVLTQAQTHIDEYTSCISDVVPPVYGDTQSEAARTYYRELALCGIGVDPAMQSELQPLLG